MCKEEEGGRLLIVTPPKEGSFDYYMALLEEMENDLEKMKKEFGDGDQELEEAKANLQKILDLVEEHEEQK